MANGTPLDAHDPYRSPRAQVDETAPADAQQVRHAHARHEFRLRAAGVPFVLFGLAIATPKLLQFVKYMPRLGWSNSNVLSYIAWILAGCLAMGIGYGYLRLRAWVRIPGGLAAAMALLWYPVGTIAGAGVLYLTFCARGRRVLSTDHELIRRHTQVPRRRPRAGEIVVALAILVAVVAGIVGWFGL